MANSLQILIISVFGCWFHLQLEQFNAGIHFSRVYCKSISSYFILTLLYWHVSLLPLLLWCMRMVDKCGLKQYIISLTGGLLLGRTVALLSVMTLATSMAARQGVIPMAAHQISMQIWLAASLLTDAIALAGQV